MQSWDWMSGPSGELALNDDPLNVGNEHPSLDMSALDPQAVHAQSQHASAFESDPFNMTPGLNDPFQDIDLFASTSRVMPAAPGMSPMASGSCAAPDTTNAQVMNVNPPFVQMYDILPRASAPLSFENEIDDMDLDRDGSDDERSLASAGSGSWPDVPSASSSRRPSPAQSPLPTNEPVINASTMNRHAPTPLDLSENPTQRLFNLGPSAPISANRTPSPLNPERKHFASTTTFLASPHASDAAKYNLIQRPITDSSSIGDEAERKLAAQRVAKAKAAAAERASRPVITMDSIRPELGKAQLGFVHAKPRDVFKYLLPSSAGDDALYTPSPEDVRDIVFAIYTHGTYDYRKAMADDYDIVALLSKWVFLMGKEPHAWSMAIAPIIMMLSCTDMPVNYIEDSRIAKRVRKVCSAAKETNLENQAGIENAFNRYLDWVAKRLVPGNRKHYPEKAKRKADDASSKARQVSAASKPSSSVRPAPPKPATLPSTARTGGFFSGAGSGSASSVAAAAGPPAKKPKLALPTIKKNAGTAPSSSYVPRQSAAPPSGPPKMSTLAAIRANLSAATTSTNTAAAQPPAITVGAGKQKLNKKGYAVRFRDAQLEQIKLFTEHPEEAYPAPWQVEDDGSQAHGQSSHQMDMNEGATLRRDAMEHVDEAEGIDWYPPDLMSADPLPEPTPEAVAQEQRERGMLASPGGVPDESGVRIVDGPPEHRYQLSIDHAQVEVAPAPGVTPVPAQSVSALLSSLGNLGAIGNLGAAAYPGPNPGFGASGYGFAQPHPQPWPSPHGAHAGYGGYDQPQDIYARPQAVAGGVGGSGYDGAWNGTGGSSSRWGNAASGGAQGGYSSQSQGQGGYGGSYNNKRTGGGGNWKSKKCRFFFSDKGNQCQQGNSCPYRHSDP